MQQQSLLALSKFRRLELKPKMSHQQKENLKPVIQALEPQTDFHVRLFKYNSLGIFHPFKSCFIASSH